MSNAYGNPTSNSATLTVTTVPPPTTNLMTNGNFESGTTAWSFYTDGVGSFTTAAPEPTEALAARIAITTPGTNVQLYQSGRALTAGVQYRLRFAARSSSGRDFSVFVHKQASPYTNYGLSNFVANLSTSWQTFTTTFTASGFAGSVS